jgi:hypothetical protein
MGVGQLSKTSREGLWKVDVEYTKKFAIVAKAAGVKHMSLLGVMNPSHDSILYYLRVRLSEVTKFDLRYVLNQYSCRRRRQRRMLIGNNTSNECRSFVRPSILATPQVR